MEESQRSLVDLERLSRAEARSSARTPNCAMYKRSKENWSPREDIVLPLSLRTSNGQPPVMARPGPKIARERRKQMENESSACATVGPVSCESRASGAEIATSDAEVERLLRAGRAAENSESRTRRGKRNRKETHLLSLSRRREAITKPVSATVKWHRL